MKNIITALLAITLVASCEKKENTVTAIEDSTESTEISQVQEPLKLKSGSGEEISVVYFAEGDAVGVKIQKTGEEEHHLSAKTTSANGNPIFANDVYMWEITQEGKGGRLTDKDGKSVEYK